jgi:threonine dehydrogenase-like Zn-dependent dehydrogenase/REP element-mobilizing transposase RayT
MKVARYVGAGVVQIVDEPVPDCPPGGLLVKTEACGLCSGELMDWYMDRKIPHVLGHEVAGLVVESEDERFPIGSRVFPHHHAPCLQCDQCEKGLYVHCPQWKRTKLIPGGMAEFFGVPAENLSDTLAVEEMRAIDAALIEPLACVMKSIKCGMGSLPMRPMTCQVMDEPPVIDKRKGSYLPHWSRNGATYFITYRLADSLPQEVLLQMRKDRERLEVIFKRGQISAANKAEYLGLIREQATVLLDSGYGECWLKREEIAEIVVENWRHFDGERYDLLAYCVMPNHVHLLVKPYDEHPLEEILHSWKSFTANAANKLLNRQGGFWQVESYDHLVRDADDYQRCLRYILENPEKAGLKGWTWVWQKGDHDLAGHGTHGQAAHATAAVIGLGVMGLMHSLLVPGCVGFEMNSERAAWAQKLGIQAEGVHDLAGHETHGLAAHATFDTVFVCPGSQAAFDFALVIANPGATVVMFAPLPPNEHLIVPQEAYFKDLRIVHSYSCGPEETLAAKAAIEQGNVKAEQVVSNFIGIDDLPGAYAQMKRGEILKPMVVFNS